MNHQRSTLKEQSSQTATMMNNLVFTSNSHGQNHDEPWRVLSGIGNEQKMFNKGNKK
jgi:hypothetical protein